MAWGDLNPRSLGYVRDAMPDFSTLHEQRLRWIRATHMQPMGGSILG